MLVCVVLIICGRQDINIPSGRTVRRIGSGPDPKISAMSEALRQLRGDFELGVNLGTAFVSMRTFGLVESLGMFRSQTQRLLDPNVRYIAEENILKRLDPTQAEFSSHHSCLPGTRVDDLEDILMWMATPSEENVLWLHGVAGAGKSTIAATVARHFLSHRRRGAFLHFHRNDTVNNNPTTVIRTLCRQLARFHPEIRKAMSKQLEDTAGIESAPLSMQFEHLLLAPLSGLTESTSDGPIIIILDALDECGGPDSRKDLLEVLRHGLPELPQTFRFLITSRDEFDMHPFLSLSNVATRELHVSGTDVMLYFRDTLSKISQRHGLGEWPDQRDTEKLVELSDGLFIWAATAVKFIEDAPSPKARLDDLLSSGDGSPVIQLDSLYEIVLESAIKNWTGPEVEFFQSVLATIILLRIPVTELVIDAILHDLLQQPSRYSAASFLRHCWSLLYWDSEHVIRFLHASFTDYLCDQLRSGKFKWSVPLSREHCRFALGCFKIMDLKLRFNIAQLETSCLKNDKVNGLAARVGEAIPPALAYATQYWVNHIQVAAEKASIREMDTGCIGVLHSGMNNLMEKQLLFWLEALSLQGLIPIASPTLSMAIQWIEVSTSGRPLRNIKLIIIWQEFGPDPRFPGLKELVVDAKKFAIAFRYPISASTPHIYLSALPFSPSNSKVLRQFQGQLNIPPASGSGQPKQWPSVVHVIDHDSNVSSVAFSPDGKQIVSGLWDNTVRVWDAVTGKAVGEPFRGHVGQVTSVAFSPDGKQIVSGSRDTTVRVWDAVTGEAVGEPFRGHEDYVTSVAFSPDGKQIVSGSWDKTIRIWDAVTGEAVGKPFQGHDHWVTSVAFSPDGKQIVSGSDDKTVRVWDAGTGKAVGEPFRGHDGFVSCVAFSPDGKQIVLGDPTVGVWDAITGKAVGEPFYGHIDRVTSVAFSPDGKQIVSGSRDTTVRVWDAVTGEAVGEPFQGHDGWVTSVAFSPDGKQIVSGSDDKTVRVWDAGTGEAVAEPFPGHYGYMTSAAFSLDGKQIVSGSP